MTARQPTITISIVCSPEQLAHVQASVSALQVDLYRLGVAFSVSTHHDPPPRPSMSLEEARRDPQAFLAGFVETDRSVRFDPELARRQRLATRPAGLPEDPAEAHAQQAFHLLGGAEAVIANLLRDPADAVARAQAQLWLQDLETL